MSLTLFLEYVTPPRIILPRVLGVCFVEDISVKQMDRDQFSEGEFNFVWLEFFFTPYTTTNARNSVVGQ